MEGVAAADNLDVLGGEGFDGLHVEAAVGQIQRHAVLQQFQAAAVEGPLKSGAADGDAGLIGTKARLSEDAGGVVEHVLQGGGTASLEFLGGDDGGTARDLADAFLGGGDGRNGQ